MENETLPFKKRTRVLVFGSNGWIGKKLVKFFYEQPEFKVEPAQGRVTDYMSALHELRRVRPDVVINAIGKTHGKDCDNIDGCLDEPGDTVKSNVLVVSSLVQACKNIGCGLVHLSSGCIFNGYPEGKPNGFTENDLCNPVSFYAERKVEAELIAKTYDRALIIRIRLPFDGLPSKRNLFNKLLGIINNPAGSYVIDAPNSMTCLDDLFIAMRELISAKAVGVYHVANPGPLRHSQIIGWMKELRLIYFIPNGVEFVTPEVFNRLQITRDRRSNCVLDTSKLEKFLGFKMRSAEEAMKACIREYIIRSKEDDSSPTN